MPPSPLLRVSPGRGQMVEKHKRGVSVDGSFPVKEEEHLELFSELQERERENFLLQLPDDFEKSFSTKLKNLSYVKVDSAGHGEGSELLNAIADKNDYDWLMTPPDTPLFPSLDDETPAVSSDTRGRPRSQPISISRSSTMDKSCRSSRGSPSPNRLSQSPRSGTSSTSHSRGRPSLSPTSSRRSVTPSRKPMSQASTSAPRSATPPSRRMVQGSISRGTSPVRTTRGNCVSPKVRAWQSSIPGLSSEAPPNLRVSLTDRPGTYVRGSPPASRSYKESGAQLRRKSTSPASRHAQNSEHISSPGRGSLNLVCEDEFDSPRLSEERLVSKRPGAVQANKSPGVLKKSNRSFSPSSAPKRSFESAVRHMENRKAPPNMFRPLLSSAPSSTFYAGKISSANDLLIYRNSSATVSSNTSSDISLSVALDTEVNEKLPECGNRYPVDIQEEILSHLTNAIGLAKVDDAIEEFPNETNLNAIESINGVSIEELYATLENIGVATDCYEVNEAEMLNLCIECGGRYISTEFVEGESNICRNCNIKDNALAADMIDLTEIYVAGDLITQSSVAESTDIGHHITDTEEKSSQSEEIASDACGIICQFDSAAAYQMDECLEEREGEESGISVLLKKSCSSTGHNFLSRSLSSSVTFDDLLHARGSLRSYRSSIGHSSTSASSSVDFSPARSGEARSQQHLRMKSVDSGTLKNEMPRRPQSASQISRFQAGEKAEGKNELHDDWKNDFAVDRHDVRRHNDQSSKVNGSDASGSLHCRGMPAAIGLSESMSVNTPGANDLFENDILSLDRNQSPVGCSSSIIDHHANPSEVEIENSHSSELESCAGISGYEQYPPHDSQDIIIHEKRESSSADHLEVQCVPELLSDTVVESNGRNLTLEEATDTILFCNSLVNDMVYHAANAAAEAASSVLTENSRPAFVALAVSNAGKREARGFPVGRYPYKPRGKKNSNDEKVPSVAAENDENVNEAAVRNVGIPKKSESLKPPKLESKCNCAIM